MTDNPDIYTAAMTSRLTIEQLQAELRDRGVPGYETFMADRDAARAERDEVEVARQEAVVDARNARAERDAALADSARLREALAELVDAVARDANERQSISGFVGARLTDARAALASTGAGWLAEHDAKTRAAALEEAAKVCDRPLPMNCDHAEAIRALAERKAGTT